MPRARLRRFFRHGFLPQLMAFEAVVRLGSVTRAAEELSLAQPTVSTLLRKLSETLGAPVTRMRERRVEATELGRTLLDTCHEVMRALERFEERSAGYDPGADSIPQWPSPSPPENPSRWKRRASPCPRARRRRERAAGEW
jgi:molybdenum-dependent DNA-binding transcriptional regulator ModE